MRVADAFAEWLSDVGITHAFGIIGAGNLALFDAIKSKGATQLICCHHEQAAVMAASFYQRACGRIALALVTTGAGSTNAITGVMAAWMDSTPVLVVSGNEPLGYFPASGSRVIGVQGYRTDDIARPFCKSAWRMSEWDRERFERIAMYCKSDRPGPVWIDIPRDVQNETVR